MHWNGASSSLAYVANNIVPDGLTTQRAMVLTQFAYTDLITKGENRCHWPLQSATIVLKYIWKQSNNCLDATLDQLVNN